LVSRTGDDLPAQFPQPMKVFAIRILRKPACGDKPGRPSRPAASSKPSTASTDGCRDSINQVKPAYSIL